MNLKKIVKIEPDDFTAYVSGAFDYLFEGITETNLPPFKKPSGDFSIGFITGPSGSGKSSILESFYGYTPQTISWQSNKAIVSHFETPEQAVERLFASGIASVPTLCKPYHVLSTGEKYRADISRQLQNNAIIDEFTSTVNRETAKSLSVSLRKYIKAKKLRNIIIASCHQDIIPFLRPDWVFDCGKNDFYSIEEPMFGQPIASVEWHV